MDYILAGLIIAFLAVFGFLQLAKIIVVKILIPKNMPSCSLLLRMQGEQDDAEMIIRSIAEKIRWKKDLPYNEIIIADCGINNKTLRILQALCEEYQFLKIIPKDNLNAYF